MVQSSRVNPSGHQAPDMIHVIGKNAKFMMTEKGDRWVLADKVVRVMICSRALYLLEAAKQLMVHKHGKPNGKKPAFMHLVDCEPSMIYQVLDYLTSDVSEIVEYIIEAEATFYLSQSSATQQHGSDEWVTEWAGAWSKVLTRTVADLIQKKKGSEFDLSACINALPAPPPLFGQGKSGEGKDGNVKEEDDLKKKGELQEGGSADKTSSKSSKAVGSDNSGPSFAEILGFNELKKDTEVTNALKTKTGITAAGVLYLQRQIEMHLLKKALYLG